MQYIGRIDKNKLGIYKDKIVTEVVILTEERINHILQHHPGDFENYSKYITQIIEDPDYILNDNKNIDTVIYLKTIEVDLKNIQIVIKLITNKLNNKFQNSIITLWKIKDKNYKQMLRNKEIIYKKS